MKFKRYLTLSKDAFLAAKEIPKQRVFSYVNKESLNEEYFKLAEKSLSDEHIYIVLSRTNTPLSNVIQALKRQEFNHTSISLDANLQTMVGYNGGNGIGKPGLNLETIELLLKNPNSEVRVLKLKAPLKRKKIIIDEIKRINAEGSSYNVAGLFIKKSFMENILICSQFVYLALEKAGLSFFVKKSFEVLPMDFINLDYNHVAETYANYSSEVEVFVKEA